MSLNSHRQSPTKTTSQSAAQNSSTNQLWTKLPVSDQEILKGGSGPVFFFPGFPTLPGRNH